LDYTRQLLQGARVVEAFLPGADQRFARVAVLVEVFRGVEKLASAKLWSCVQWASLMSQTHPLTTTTFDLPGYRVVKSFGMVRGIIVRSRSIIGNIGASIQSLFGGNISLYTSLCERARDDAFRQMLAHAGELGANAVVGVRYDATEIGNGITEVLCYGTAVFVEAAP
jgi:uncharacterized protein YbjQ (UPF0145 family)